MNNNKWKNGICWNMWDTKFQINIYWLTYSTASRPAGWDGSGGHFDGYDASWVLTCCDAVKFDWSRNNKTNERVVYVNICGILNVK